MPVCAKAIQQADGVLLLALDPLATDLTACTYVVESGAEIANSMFSMTAQDGGAYSAAIIGCWILAYCVRTIVQIIKGSENE